jgi:hypothetical protein
MEFRTIHDQLADRAVEINVRNPTLIIEPGRLAIRLGDLCLHHEVSTVRALANDLQRDRLFDKRRVLHAARGLELDADPSRGFHQRLGAWRQVVRRCDAARRLKLDANLSTSYR